MLIKLFRFLLYCFALIGIISILYFINKNSIKQYHNIEDKRVILKKLTELSNSKISVKNCEHVNNIKNLKVSDFLTAYLDSMSSEKYTKIEFIDLTCGSRKENECSVYYGGKDEWNKGWTDILFFDYDKVAKIINQNSFEYFCQ
ncbi:hypothetical protein CRV00_12830 [Malaciobacter molluscorum]|uniref:hypothetical protein n=1 Tax=Malaciobacter molluscorum TaxID=1032072 RepID=UPI00100B7BC4|nr:hypothetical protein [Malaciobacter molluscorum]RXJ92535.1 hypothetical protein CRV00_12830 [Malaciobacter molluscorum]